MAHYHRYSRFFLLALIPVLFILAGCVGTKTLVPPYQGQKEQDGAGHLPVNESAVKSGTPDTSAPPQAGTLPQEESLSGQDDLLLPVLTRINERIFAYEQKLARLSSLESSLSDDQERLDKLAGCRDQMEEILTQYNALHQQFLGRDRITSRELLLADTLFDLENRDFAFLEGECQQILAQGHSSRKLAAANSHVIEQRAESIRKAFARSDYRSVIEEYEQIAAQLSALPTYELTFLYGKALIKSGQEKKARSVLAKLLNGLGRQDQIGWAFALLQLTGDLNFALRHFEPAREQYNNLIAEYERVGEYDKWARQQLVALDATAEQSAEVRAYVELLRSYLTYNPERDGYTVVRRGEEYLQKYPYSPVAANVETLVKASRKEADDWYRTLLARVDALTQEHKYQEALLLIEKVPRMILPVDKQQELADKARELRNIETVSRQSNQRITEQQAQENWNAGMIALAAREYDKAIDAFSNTLGTSYDARAREKINEAANLAAREDRRRAAEFFVRSRRTQDPRERKKLLLASRQLLQDILIKYPQADLIDKVKRNLRRIDQEIEAIDPDLLNTPVTVGGTLQTLRSDGDRMEQVNLKK